MCIVLSTQTRHAWYVLPIYPPLGLLVAGMGVGLWRRLFSSAVPGSTSWFFLQRTAFVTVLIWSLLPLPGYGRQLLPGLLWVEAFYQDRNTLLQEHRDQLDPQVPLYAVGVHMPGVVFYSQRAAVFLAETELANFSTLQTPAYILVHSSLAATLSERGFLLLGRQREWVLLAYLPMVQVRTEERDLAQGEESTNAL
jgi:hypothetical protein